MVTNILSSEIMYHPLERHVALLGVFSLPNLNTATAFKYDLTANLYSTGMLEVYVAHGCIEANKLDI